MSWNTSTFIESINSLITVMSSFEVDSDEAGEAYIQIREELSNMAKLHEIDMVFELLVYALTLSTLSMNSDHSDFKSFWQQYLLCLDKASDEFLLSSCGDVEAILPYLHALMTGRELTNPGESYEEYWTEDED